MRDRVENIVSSSYSSKRNGVVIVFKKHLNVNILKQRKDDQGKVVCVGTILWNKQNIFCNISGPNAEDPDLFHKLNDFISNIAVGYIILAGDFNQVVDGELYQQIN